MFGIIITCRKLSWKRDSNVKPQNYRWQNRKVRILHRLFLKVGLLQWRMKVLPWRTLRPPTSPHPPGRGEWGWLQSGPGQYQPPNLIRTQSLHLKNTCGKRAQCPIRLPLDSFLFCHLQFCVWNIEDGNNLCLPRRKRKDGTNFNWKNKNFVLWSFCYCIA